MSQLFIKNPSSIFCAPQQHRCFQANRAITQQSQALSIRNRQPEQHFQLSPTIIYNNINFEETGKEIYANSCLRPTLPMAAHQGSTGLPKGRRC